MPKTKPRPKPKRWTGDPNRPHEIFQTVATTIMAVPEATRTRFLRTIERFVQDMWIPIKPRSVAHDRQAINKIVSALKKLDHAVKQLTESAELRLGEASWDLVWRAWCEQRGHDFRDGMRKLTDADHEHLMTFIGAFPNSKTIEGLQEFPAGALELASAAVRDLRYRPKSKRRGRPQGFTNDRGYLLAVGLIEAAMDYGGKITVYPKSATGTLVEAQECLRVLLPAGFKVYSPSSLKKILRGREEHRANTKRG